VSIPLDEGQIAPTVRDLWEINDSDGLGLCFRTGRWFGKSRRSLGD
jgi:hypothetical protein